MLRGPLTALVVGLCAFQLAAWIPHLLTWPFFVDHDVFSTLAFGWDSGLRPYHDLRENNFPGTIYLFWAVGKVFGWGRTAPVFAADSAFVVAFGEAMLLWSRRRFGRFLPGAIGYASFLSYYLSLDYRNVIQKDWHGPFFMMLGLMITDGWPTRGGRIASAFCAAAAFVIRPQVVLLAPALAFRIARGDDRVKSSWSPARRPSPRSDGGRWPPCWPSWASCPSGSAVTGLTSSTASGSSPTAGSTTRSRPCGCSA